MIQVYAYESQLANPNIWKLTQYQIRALSEGGKASFYTGRIAESVARCVREHGGVMTEDDLAAHVRKGSDPQTHVEPVSSVLLLYRDWLKDGP